MSSAIQPFDRPRTFDRKLLITLAIHAALWGIWLLELFRFAPYYENIYQNLGMRLPQLSAFVLSLTRGSIPSALLLAVIFVTLDIAVSYRLRRSASERLWARLMTIAPVAAILLTGVAICLPALKIVEALAR